MAGLLRVTRVLSVAGLLAALLLVESAARAQANVSAVPVPFTTVLAGTGSISTTTCTTGIATTSGISLGDGCAPATAGLDAPQGAAVDKYGNVYVADYLDHAIRVIYNGGASLAAAITAANSGYAISSTRTAPAPVPVAGSIYTLAGFGSATPAALTATQTDGKFACANYAATGQPEALNSLGDGCPAASATVGPRAVTVDTDGNLFLTDYTNSRIRLLCVNCAATTMAAQLIAVEEPGVTPVNGAMYTIAGYAGGYRDAALGFGNATAATVAVALLRSPTSAALSSSDDVYIADNINNAVRLLYNGGAAAKALLTAEGITPTVGFVYTIAGAGCVSAATGKTGSVVGANSCLTTKGTDAATLGNALPTNQPWTVYLDPNNNVFFSDAPNQRIKFLYGGLAAPVSLPTTAYPTLQTGYAYSFAGQGTATTSGVAPNQILLAAQTGTSIVGGEALGGDAGGDVFFADYVTGLFYEVFARSGLTAVIGGGNANGSPAAGAYCNGGSTGPKMTDAFYDGCPLTQATIVNPRGSIVADASGTLYLGDSPGSLLRRFSYNPSFPATTAGVAGAVQPYAFTFLSNQTLTANTVTVDSNAGATFQDAGADTCTAGLAATAGGPGTTCVVNVQAAAAQPGLQIGAVQLNSASGVLGESFFSAVSLGAGLVVDPGTASITGTGLSPNGIAVDTLGRVLVTDTTSMSLMRFTGGNATTVATGFSAPSGVAFDAAGNLFVADTSANTVTELPLNGTRFTLTSSVSAPHGLAVDGTGALYVADTGNNRVLKFGVGATLPAVMAFSGLSAPQAIAVDANGNLYATDSTHTVKLTAAGVQTTVATGSATGVAVDAAGNVLITTGTTLVEYPSGGGSAVTLSGSLVSPRGLALNALGNAYVADSGLAGFLELQRTGAGYTFPTSPGSTNVTLSSVGNTSLTGESFTQTDSNDFSLVPATTNGCSGALAPGITCSLAAGFTPVNPGTVTDVVTFASNAVNASTVTLTLTGTTFAQSTTTSFTVSPAAPVYGQVVSLTARVAGPSSAPTSGTVNFMNGSTLLGSAAVGSGGVATLSLLPAVATYNVTAVFAPTGVGFANSTSAAQMFAVTAAVLTVSANNTSKVLNAANPALTYTIDGFVAGNSTSVVTGAPAESTTAVTASPLGTYPITVAAGTLAAANYTFSFVPGTLTVTGSTAQTVSFTAPASVTYGTAPITLTGTASSGLAVSYIVSGPAALSGSSLTVTGAGTVTVTAQQNGNNTYAGATPVVQTIAVAKAPLSLAGVNATRVYGAANPPFSYVVTGFVNGDTQATAVTGAPAETSTATAGSAVGPYPIALAQGSAAAVNYSFSFTGASLTVTSAALTVTANNATRAFGAANPVFAGTISGTVNNDVLTETFTTTAVAASPGGTYPIVPGVSGANAGNYTVSATNGTLTVTQVKPGIVLTASAATGFTTTTINLTATLSSPTAAGLPTGSVTFYAGTTAVGMGTVAGGVATLATTSLPLGANSVTAVYAGDASFVPATSAAVTVTIVAGFGVAPSATALAFQQNYQEAQAILTVTPGGRTDTLSFACTGLPAKLTCAFTPGTLPLAGVTTAQSVQMLVSNSAATAGLERPGVGRAFAFAALPLGAMLLLGLRRRRFASALLAAVLLLAVSVSLGGCGSSSGLDQGSGNYSFSVTVNSGATTLQTIPFTLMVP